MTIFSISIAKNKLKVRDVTIVSMNMLKSKFGESVMTCQIIALLMLVAISIFSFYMHNYSVKKKKTNKTSAS
ncbi:hypothetical protein BSQ40_25880 [Serratia fonticola]|nr:hypothetical protein BSQ40_25880 [Serratia fonticola]